LSKSRTVFQKSDILLSDILACKKLVLNIEECSRILLRNPNEPKTIVFRRVSIFMAGS